MSTIRKSAAVLFVLALGLAACKPKDESAGNASNETPAAAAPAAPAGGADEVRYLCSSGLIIPVTYKPGFVTLTYKDKAQEMKVDTANADRYIGEGMEWWINGRGQGSNGNLFAQGEDGTAGDLIEGCVENPRS